MRNKTPQDIYEKLGDGQHFDAAQKQVSFKSRKSADAFKRCCPDWRVTYTRATVGIGHLSPLH